MLYRLYLYKTKAVNESALAIRIINDAIDKYLCIEKRYNEAAHYLLSFDTGAITERITAELTDPETKACKCSAITLFPPKEYPQIGYIYVRTSYIMAKEVLPRLYAIAAENDIALYDAETGKTFYRELIDDSYITMRNRQKMLYKAVAEAMKPIWRIRRLELVSEKRDKYCSYVVTVKKDPSVSFQERTAQLYNCLLSNLTGDETLVCDNKCYTINGTWYSITFVLEGYKKHANQIGYTENGRHYTELIRRMSADEAFGYSEKCSDTEQGDIFARMRFREMVNAYPNPAQRFVASVNITKWQRKQVLGIRYSGMGYYGAEILFHVLPNDYEKDSVNISVLKISEESASFFLPFVEEFYPDFNKRYYSIDNHLPPEMWKRIVERLKEVKEMILHDTFNPLLKPYIEKFDLYTVSGYNIEECRDKIQSDEVQYLYDNRYTVAGFYDAFIQWSEAQLNNYYRCGDDRLFNIQGP